MRATNWYVVQVQAGQESRACEAITRACGQHDMLRQAEHEGDDERPPVLRECFTPMYVTQFKLHGEWHDEQRLLLPGYVVAVTEDPGRLARALRRVSRFTRILRMGEAYVPLSDVDRSWIERWTSEGDRVIPMSFGHREGDTLVITEGPLKGHEAMVKKIKRRLSYVPNLVK